MLKKISSCVCTLWLMIACSYGQDIRSSAAIVLPVSPQTTYATSSGSTVNIVSGVSVSLQPGTTLTSGSAVNIFIDNSLSVAPAPSNPANDYDKNWILTRNYDENGHEIGSSKSFFDNSGKPTQSQIKNETYGHVLASQTLYDLQGRAVVTTLPAPINNSGFAYNNNFVTNNGLAYNYLNFDGDPSNASNSLAKLNMPDPVDYGTKGSLGWYYSDNNSFEPMVAATRYPYSRVDFYHDGTGATKRLAGVGEELKMGKGREESSNSFPVQNELNNYLAIRNQFFPAATVGSTPSTLAGQALQTVSTDQNGTSVLSVTDLSGKMNLMVGRADPNGYIAVANTINITNVQPLYSFTAANTGFSILSLKVSSPNTVSVVSLNDHTDPSCGCVSPNYTGVGSNYSYSGNDANSYQITSVNPFSVTETVLEAPLQKPIVTLYDQAEPQVMEPSGTSVKYFQLSSAGPVSITGGQYTLFNMTSEADITSSFTNGGILPAGYYKLTANPAPLSGANPTGVSNVSVTYTNKYTDITYNYYNQLGQLIASIAPKGVQALAPPNNLSSYSSASALPYVTLYQYDLQGRLISSTSPDGGTSQFIYRQDGKIRFSQNAYQQSTANAGAGKEQLSYTNYDIFGRPVESGEYVTTANTFAGLAANATLLEATGPVADIAGATKLSQFNTYYDLAATNLSLVGYSQDPGFLKGAVSYTTNANSTTWYNYDDHGRLSWAVKQLAGLSGYKTVDYTYNEQGNVTRVDYQKETSAERFIHYYAYDADGRLVNVQTSRDDVNKLQQANYVYYLHGPLKRTELADNLQGTDYTYTPQGWLKAINTPAGDASQDPGKDGSSGSAFAKDAFGMQLEYFANDYGRTNSNITPIPTSQQTYYNGNVNGISWQSNKPASITGLNGPTMYTYGYDAKYQLTGATWGTPNFVMPGFTAGSIFKESGITYDANGNINGLQRTNSIGALSDDFSKYTYLSGTNKLSIVGNAAGTNNYASYTYNELGQLKSQTKGSSTSYIKYDVTGKITGVYSDAAMNAPNALVTYSYDESGNRIKMVNQNGITYYVYDTFGNVMAIYTGASTPVMSEVPVYGSDRLGTYFVTGNNYNYELRDNVGSVKVVINRNKAGGQADVIQYNDYYPFGSIARNGGAGYRYEYQGAYAEKDPVTGFNNFDLRMYDGKIGRWLSKDPAGQYASPYEGMGNNPVNGSDPTGAFWQEFGNWLTGNGWISNAGVDFINAHPGATNNGWTGDKSNGFATVGYQNDKGESEYKTFDAIDDFVTGKVVNGALSFDSWWQKHLGNTSEQGTTIGGGYSEHMNGGLGIDQNRGPRSLHPEALDVTDFNKLIGLYSLDPKRMMIGKWYVENPFFMVSSSNDVIPWLDDSKPSATKAALQPHFRNIWVNSEFPNDTISYEKMRYQIDHNTYPKGSVYMPVGVPQ